MAKMLGYQPFQRRSSDRLRAVQRSLGSQRLKYLRVKKVEFGMVLWPATGAFSENLKSVAQQCVLKYIYIPRDCFATDLDVIDQMMEVVVKALL